MGVVEMMVLKRQLVMKRTTQEKVLVLVMDVLCYEEKIVIVVPHVLVSVVLFMINLILQVKMYCDLFLNDPVFCANRIMLLSRQLMLLPLLQLLIRYHHKFLLKLDFIFIVWDIFLFLGDVKNGLMFL